MPDADRTVAPALDQVAQDLAAATKPLEDAYVAMQERAWDRVAQHYMKAHREIYSAKSMLDLFDVDPKRHLLVSEAGRTVDELLNSYKKPFTRAAVLAQALRVNGHHVPMPYDPPEGAKK